MHRSLTRRGFLAASTFFLAACKSNGGSSPAADATVVGFKYSHQGMAREPYYSIRPVRGGYELATTCAELYWSTMDGKELVDELDRSTDGTYAYDRYAGGFPDGRMFYSRAQLTDDDMAEFSELLAKHGVFGWDGFDEVRKQRPGFEATDSGATFNLKVLCSDGSRVTAHGIDTQPDGADEAVLAMLDFFEAHGVS